MRVRSKTEPSKVAPKTTASPTPRPASVKTKTAAPPKAKDAFAPAPAAPKAPTTPEELKKANAQMVTSLLQSDPKLERQLGIFQALSAERTQLADELKATQTELEAWRKKNGGYSSMGRLLQGVAQADAHILNGDWQFWKGMRTTITNPELDGPAPQRARIAELANQLGAVDEALKGIADGKSPQKVSTGSFQIDELLKSAKADKPL
jgi:hypothetical protein